MNEIKALALRMARRAVDILDSPEGVGYGAAGLAKQFEQMLRTLPKVDRISQLHEGIKVAVDALQEAREKL